MAETDRDNTVDTGMRSTEDGSVVKDEESGSVAKTGESGKDAGASAAKNSSSKSAARGDRAGAAGKGRRSARAGKAVKTGGSGRLTGRGKNGAVSRRNRKSTSQTITKSFRHAFDGIISGFEERNMKIHCTMALLVVFFGLVLHISVTEWCICVVLFGLIMGLELVNTAIEAVVDLVTQEYHPLAKRAKDAAAGAVLIASIMAAAAGLIIFIPRLLYVIKSF